MWILGAEGFTGGYLIPILQEKGYIVETEQVDITDIKQIESAILRIQPTYVVNLAGISFVPDGGSADIYAINTLGPQKILNACLKLAKPPKRIILASSSHVYGEQEIESIDESCTVNPINHYGCSKWSMEQIAATYNDQLNILITRPFNYTGVGQAEHFLIPKIVSHFKNKEKTISLGNIDIWRDFSDVKWISQVYAELLTTKSEKKIFNLCSSQLTSLREIIETAQEESGYTIDIQVNPEFIRKTDPKKQQGNNQRLLSELKNIEKPHNIKETLRWMLG